MSQTPDVDVVTFGCRLNAVESEAIRRAARAAGHHDLVVFNTCAVTQEAVRQARQAIRRTRRERPEARIVVTGCAAQIDPQGFAEIADSVIGNADKAKPAILSAEVDVREDWQGVAGRNGVANDGESAGEVVLDYRELHLFLHILVPPLG